MDPITSPLHKHLAEGRWAEMNLCEQLANIGSEVSRALNWRKKGNPQLSKNAIIRALELIDLSLKTTKTYPRLKELARMREAITDDFYGNNDFLSTEESWRKYFDYFAIAAKSKLSL